MSKIKVALFLEYKIVEGTEAERSGFAPNSGDAKIGVATDMEIDLDKFRSNYLQMSNAILKLSLEKVFDFKSGPIAIEGVETF